MRVIVCTKYEIMTPPPLAILGSTWKMRYVIGKHETRRFTKLTINNKKRRRSRRRDAMINNIFVEDDKTSESAMGRGKGGGERREELRLRLGAFPACSVIQ